MIKSETNWLKKLIYTGLIVCICWLVAIIVVVIFNLNKSQMFYPMWITISILVYWIGYVGINKSTQLKKRIQLRNKRILEFYKNRKINTTTNAFERLEKQIVENKMYLNPNLNLKNLSHELDLSEGYISQLINKNSKFNFNDFINKLRVEDAKLMLKNNEYINYTVGFPILGHL